MEYCAHISDDGRRQTVAEHLTGTAALCRAFAGAFGAEAEGELMGLAHDIGKCTDSFQKRLLEDGPIVDHATAGAVACAQLLRTCAAACVAGHHSGLPDLGNPRTDRAGDATLYLPLWAMLRETVNLNSRDKVPSPAMAGATARAVFSGGRYPASLLEATMLRIRAERNITWGRAAIIKAYYLKNPLEDCPKEVLTVSLNESSTDTAYTLGRLFSVYEAVQQSANPGINATIKDKYFNSAAAMPASIFPVLNNLYQKHLRKLEAGQRVYYDKQIMALKSILGESYPARMTLAQQGSFDLGYYHQTQKRYTKKEEENNV